MRIRKHGKLGTIVLGGIVAAFTTFVGLSMYASHRSDLINKGYAQIKIGDAESRVLGLMGTPDRTVFPGDDEFWSWKGQECVKQYQYHIRILPELWVIGFDSEGKVIQRDHNVM